MRLANSDKRYVFIPIMDMPAGVDPAALSWEAALVADDGSEPSAGDWKPAAWADGEVYFLVGPGSPNTYQPDRHYMAWVTVTAGAEEPVLRSGRVTIGDPD